MKNSYNSVTLKVMTIAFHKAVSLELSVLELQVTEQFASAG